MKKSAYEDKKKRRLRAGTMWCPICRDNPASEERMWYGKKTKCCWNCTQKKEV